MNAALALRESLKAHTDSLKARLGPDTDIIALIHERAAVMDALLVERWQALGLEQGQLALIAVGGYGRGELHPYSDVDILVLSEKELTAPEQDSISQFITELWDARLDIGHATRTLADCLDRAKDDITIATNLLEARLLCGPQGLFDALKRGLSPAHCWPVAAFFKAKADEQIARHGRYDSTAYNLEPNLKGNPGGLRDIQTVVWVLLRHLNRKDLPALAEQGWLEQEELDELIACRDHLWRLRFALHLAAGRSEDRLLFDLQPEVARLLGFEGDNRQAVEAMMQQLYQTLRRVSELNAILLEILAEELSPEPHPPSRRLDDLFDAQGSQLLCREPGRLGEQPHYLLDLFLHLARDSNLTGIAAGTLRALRALRRDIKAPLCEDPPCRERFMALLRHPRGLGLPFKLMHRHGIMAAYLPAWGKIVGQMQFDLFHAYTVDEHTYRVVRNAYRFSLPDRAKEFPLASLLVRQMRKPELLYLAALFHDIAKGRGGDHSELGAADALAFGQSHGLSDIDTRLIAWLVEHHLVMSVTAQRRDISDPEVIRQFAALVRDETHLNYLYCLTVADIRATNDKLWNDWKGSLLRELYFASQKALRRGLEKPIDIRPAIREAKEEAGRLLAKRAISQSALKALWQRFRADYFLRHSPEQIAWHAEAILKHQHKDGPLVKLSKHTTRGGTELFVYTRDRPQLFAGIASVLDGKNLSIFDAQVMTSKDGWALDSLVVVERDGSPVESPSRVQSTRRALEKALLQAKLPKPAQRPLPRQLKPFKVPTDVTFLPSSRKQSLAEFTALDRPGLLAQVGQVFAECGVSLKAAKITTIGERAEDFFILTTLDGEALSDDEQQQLRDALVDALAQ
ncbi:[protein-PII] uridylyltransferase [Gallaecimonas kandeliae]|uniref:[protein-PII] uridylyltransferase n=1 Tax=Gallaecimonas kandeliae TaxID=3029055 RepID=UPI002647FF29|nr:[protein-PII] uridylyltransferase [Gallaecimonas kandeliae]WKE64530.1 [protein-PII] uridylyltransferase [Gallaecimonas kandeliae]